MYVKCHGTVDDRLFIYLVDSGKPILIPIQFNALHVRQDNNVRVMSVAVGARRTSLHGLFKWC